MLNSLAKRLLVVVVLIFVFLCGCGSKGTDTEIGNNIKVGSLIEVPGRESEGLVYHKTSKTVYVLEIEHEGMNYATGFCALYRENNTFWKYDEKNKKIVPETDEDATNTYADLSDKLEACNEQNTDFVDVIMDYIEEHEHEITDKQKDDLIFKLIDLRE